MPVVPTQDNFGALPTPVPQNAARPNSAPDIAGQQVRAMGQGLLQAGGALSAMQLEANKLRIDDTTNQAMKEFTRLESEMSQVMGKDAIERREALPDEYTKRLNDSLEKLGSSLGNEEQKQAWSQISGEMKSRMYAKATDHMVRQKDVYQKEVWQSGMSTAVDRGTLLYADKEARLQSENYIASTVDEMAIKYGWDKDVRDQKFREFVSPLHSGVIDAMIKDDHADLAMEYYSANSANMTTQARANLQSRIADAQTTQAGEKAADLIWKEYGPTSINDPVKLFDMEQAMRTAFADNPDSAKKGIAALRERYQAFNQQQSEVSAANINGVWRLIDSGVGMRAVRNSPEWLSLTGKERRDIEKSMLSDSLTSAQLTNLQRQEKLNLLMNGDEYLTISDPTVLGKMTRAQVEATRSKFGMEATQTLLNKWDQLRNPGAMGEAKIDKQDFDMVADSLGLNPYAKGLSEEKKRALGTLQFRIEQLIDLQQRELGKKLDRQEKMKLMKEEMSKQVLVKGGLFSSDKSKPVVQLTKDEISKVIVPEADRAQIVEAMRLGNAKYPNDPRFMPTEDNVKRMYLRKQSSAGDLILNAE